MSCPRVRRLISIQEGRIAAADNVIKQMPLTGPQPFMQVLCIRAIWFPLYIGIMLVRDLCNVDCGVSLVAVLPRGDPFSVLTELFFKYAPLYNNSAHGADTCHITGLVPLAWLQLTTVKRISTIRRK